MASARNCYPLTPLQLRRAHDFDWECCSKYFGMPLRVCSTVEKDDSGKVVSEEDFEELLRYIDTCWRKASSVLAVFESKSEKHLGWRLKVRDDLPIHKL